MSASYNQLIDFLKYNFLSKVTKPNFNSNEIPKIYINSIKEDEKYIIAWRQNTKCLNVIIPWSIIHILRVKKIWYLSEIGLARISRTPELYT